MRRKVRSRWEIILDILKATEKLDKEAKKTRIMGKTYLEWRSFQRRFGYLLEQGFIGDTVDLKRGTSYYLTEKGTDLMQKLEEVKKLLS